MQSSKLGLMKQNYELILTSLMPNTYFKCQPTYLCNEVLTNAMSKLIIVVVDTFLSIFIAKFIDYNLSNCHPVGGFSPRVLPRLKTL